MAPTVILIRHGEALHKIAMSSDVWEHEWELPDPELTKRGLEQCSKLAADLEERLPFGRDECRIVVSPLKRTLQTVRHGLQWLQNLDVPVEVRAEWQETSDNRCDIGTEVALLQKDWPDFDFSGLDPVYPQKTGLYEASEDAFRQRASFAIRWLFERPEKCIVVVTHSGFLKRALNTGESDRFQHVEYRIYEFDVDSEGPQLREIDRRKPLESSPDSEERQS
ncbi:hypothetical protein DL767_008724 [Monosporascus sp. MG133]|nr:hypothetical protein DL767_008724 [Monosporascus sp. MG133]